MSDPVLPAQNVYIDPAAPSHETLADYRPGGYHPVQLGDAYRDSRYIVRRKLGWGQFSTVWLVDDTKHSTQNALKIMRSAKNYTEAAKDEIRILTTLNHTVSPGSAHLTTLIDHFRIAGPNGSHVSILMDLAGDELLTLIERTHYKGVPPCLGRQVALHVLRALSHMHAAKIIHADLKPENILINIPASAVTLCNSNGDGQCSPQNHAPLCFKVCDFGNAMFLDDIFTTEIQTKQYRCPEVLLGGRIGPATDIWSWACTVFEIITGDFLFTPHAGREYSCNEDHLAQMIELLGAFPSSFLSKCKRARHYLRESTGTPRSITSKLRPWDLTSVLREKYKFPVSLAGEISDFLLPALALDPAQRAPAKTLLQHPFLSAAIEFSTHTSN